MAWVKTAMVAALGVVVGLGVAGRWLDGGGASGLGLAPLTAVPAAVAPAPDTGGDTEGKPGPAIVGPARVIDGDTLRIGSVRIRIQGIDAPETDDRCQRPDGRGWDCGVWATRLARDAFEGRSLVCHDLGERSYDRVVGRCMDGDRDFAEVMLRAGAARACDRFALRHAHSRGYMALEAEAAAAGIGIFDGRPPPRAGFCLTRAGTATAPAPQRVPERLAAAGCDIKGNINAAGERIYHLPGQAHYDRVVIRPELGQRWFCSEEEAEATGWRRSLR